MLRLALTGAAVAAGLAAVPRPAAAEPHMGDYLVEVARGLAGENLPVAPRPAIVAVGGGVTDLDDLSWMAGAGAGVTWGKENTGLFGEIKLHRILLSGRWSSDDEDTATFALMYGYTMSSILGYTLEAGAQARASDQKEIGPAVRATIRMGPVGLFVGGFWYASAPDAGGLDAGLSVDLLGMQRAKQ